MAMFSSTTGSAADQRVAETPTAAASAAGKPTAAASEKVATSAQLRYDVASVILILIGALGGWLLQHRYHPGLANLPELAAGVSPFALLYVFAQSIERLLQPFSPLLGGCLGIDRKWPVMKGKLVKTRNDEWAAAMNGKVGGGTAAADAQRMVNQFRANSSALSFGLAAAIAMVACGYLGVFFLHSLGVTSTGIVLDLLITGLAVGGGTKPLHDLISNVQKAKDAKQDPKELTK